MKEKVLNEIVDNTVKLIEFKTIANNFLEFDKAYIYIKEQLGNYNIKECIINGYKNLVISNCDSNDFDLILCGHLDVVENETYEAKIIDNKIYGRGAFDMKGQLAVLISLLKNNESNKKIALIITSDEEIGGYCCKEIMKDYSSKLAFIPDAGKNFELITEEKGLLQLEIKCKGISAHASEPFKGDNAILKLFDIYHKILEIYPMPLNEDDFKTSVNLSKLNGGNSNNKVPEYASMVLDIRFTNKDSIEEIIYNIKKISEDIEVNLLDSGPVFHVSENLGEIKNFIKNAEKVLERKIKITKCLATSDAIYFSEKNIPTILMNPIGDYWHNPNEYVDINSLYDLYCILTCLL